MLKLATHCIRFSVNDDLLVVHPPRRLAACRRKHASGSGTVGHWLSRFCRLAAVLSLIIIAASGAARETPVGNDREASAMDEKISEKDNLLEPGYDVAESARDPFFSVESQKPEEPLIPKAPSASNLLAFLQIAGLMGKPENPQEAGVLVGNKIYRVGDTVPIVAGQKVYTMQLIAVRFPDTVEFKYKDETATKTIGRKKTNGD